MSDTPRTDRAQQEATAAMFSGEPVDVTRWDFARELERENEQLKDLLKDTPRADRPPLSYEAGYDFAYEKEIIALKEENERLREALEIFAHPDLGEKLGGNALGDDSIIFQRNRAKITLGDCRRAARAIKNATEVQND